MELELEVESGDSARGGRVRRERVEGGASSKVKKSSSESESGWDVGAGEG